MIPEPNTGLLVIAGLLGLAALRRVGDRRTLPIALTKGVEWGRLLGGDMPFVVNRAFVTAALIIGFSTASNATTLSVSPDKLTYNVGETVTLSVSGDAQGATAYGIFGRLEYTGSGSVTPQTQTQKVVRPGAINLSITNGPGFSDAFQQVVSAGTAQTASNLPADNPFSTVTLIASAVGLVNVNWNATPGSGFELTFFGLTNAPGTSFTIVGAIPEPTTGALLGLGLLGLGMRRRVRD